MDKEGHIVGEIFEGDAEAALNRNCDAKGNIHGHKKGKKVVIARAHTIGTIRSEGLKAVQIKGKEGAFQAQEIESAEAERKESK